MITSAQALNQLLASISREGSTSERFVSVAARHLKLEGEDAEVRALSAIHDLLRRIRSEIEALPFDEQTKKQARSYLAPFEHLLNFAHFHLDMSNAMQNFLKPGNLVGLVNLHMALFGKSNALQPTKEFYEIASEMREYILEVNTLNLPSHVKKLIHRRLEQIASTLENSFFYGGERIQEELEALAGTVALNVVSADDQSSAILRKLSSSILKTLRVLGLADQGLGIAIGLVEKTKELGSIFDSDQNGHE